MIKFFEKQYNVVPLDEIGIKDFGFYYDDAVSYICDVVKSRKRILGGDIILRSNGQWDLSVDSWYSEKLEPEETLKDALCFLQKYKAQAKNEWIVCVVVEN